MRSITAFRVLPMFDAIDHHLSGLSPSERFLRLAWQPGADTGLRVRLGRGAHPGI